MKALVTSLFLFIFISSLLTAQVNLSESAAGFTAGSGLHLLAARRRDGSVVTSDPVRSASEQAPSVQSKRKRAAGSQSNAGAENQADAAGGDGQAAAGGESGAGISADDEIPRGRIQLSSLSKEQQERLYNLQIDGQIAGPYTMATIALMARTGLIKKSTPVRSDRTNGWTKVGVLVDFSPLFK